MSDFLREHGLAIFSLCVAIAALLLNRRASRLNSYSQRGNYLVFFQRERKMNRWLNGPSFSVKEYDSIHSNIIPLDYNLKIKPLLGGVYRAHLFEDLERKNYTGTTKTLPVVRTYENRSRFPNKYAHQDMITFSSTPFYPYFSVNGKYNEEANYFEERLCRYHNYIEIIDYCGNTEIWYVSFSLHLSNVKHNKHWRECDIDSRFKYYRFNDFNIVSSRDIPANLNATLQFNKDLSTISGKVTNTGSSPRFIKLGFDKINSELQLHEMKAYISFLNRLRHYI